MIKGTVLYGHPKDAVAFEKYYSETHLPLVTKTPGVIKAEYTKFFPNPDGSPSPWYRMALNSPEGKAMAADLQNFASGGVTIIFGKVE